MAAMAVKANLTQMGKKVLLVEGVDDWHNIRNLICATTGALPPYEVGECENDDGLMDRLTAMTETSRQTQMVLGAVLDADRGKPGLSGDTGLQHRIRSLQGRLGTYYEIPDEFPKEGLILPPRAEKDRDRLPILGVWLMPDNQRDGIFEDLLRAAMTPASETYISAVVDKAKNDGVATYKEVERSKAIIRTHVAWQDPDKKNLGEAIGTHFTNLAPACQRYLEWLQRLFGERVT